MLRRNKASRGNCSISHLEALDHRMKASTFSSLAQFQVEPIGCSTRVVVFIANKGGLDQGHPHETHPDTYQHPDYDAESAQ